MSSKIAAPRGTQDTLPPQSGSWRELESRLAGLAQRFGYGEVRTPTFEYTELFERGVGEATDIVEKEMYSFVDKGGRRLTLRPEWTAPVVRAALGANLFVQGAARLYYIGSIYRYERPQRGRYRQSHQFGVECFGFAGPEAEVEVIALVDEVLRSYGIHGVRLNLNSIGDEHCRPRYRQALLDYLRPYRSELSEESQQRLERNPLRVLDSKDERDQRFLQTVPTFESILCEPCRDHFEAVKGYLDALKIAYTVNPRIVRGLDYYTRTVFEFVSDALGAQGTICGGGRYDGLVESLGGPSLPAVGFGLGLERFLMLLEALHGEPPRPRNGIQAIALGQEARVRLVPIVAGLRRLGACTFIDYEERKLLGHLKIADRNAAGHALILGSDELASGEIILRNLERRVDRRLPLSPEQDVAAAIVKEVG
ncbi:MAG: histidine--tRNA ligase [Vulcanimicrobiaceae bacterium]